MGKIGIWGLSDPNFSRKSRFMASLLISKDCITTCCNYVVTLTITRLPSVVILENIHSQGSKIIQILAKLEVQCTWYNAVCDDFIQGCLGEAPFIVCTSNPTEYISDLSQVIVSIVSAPQFQALSGLSHIIISSARISVQAMCSLPLCVAIKLI